jgi:hypothetical protein
VAAPISPRPPLMMAICPFSVLPAVFIQDL